MFEKTNKMEYTREDNVWRGITDEKTTDFFGSDESMAYRLLLTYFYYQIHICVQSKQDRKQKEYLTFVDYLDGTLLDYVKKSNKIIAIKNDVVKIIV